MIDVHIGPGRCPPEIDAALKAIDPEAELVHLEGRKWWLGVKAPNPAAVEQLADAHQHATVDPTLTDPVERAMVAVELAREFQMFQVMARGFKPVALYTVGAGSDDVTFGQIVEDFRIRDYNWRTKTAAQLERELRDSISMDKANRGRIAEWGKKATDAAAEAFRFVFKGARSFTRRAIGQRRRRVESD